jgi:hypothetical protein
MQPAAVRFRRLFLLPTVALMVLPLVRAQEIGTLTLLRDSPLRVIRGVSVFQGVEGMRLRQGDILETGPAATAQAQLEFTGGAIVDLGPSSRAFLFSESGLTAEIVLLTGWLKGETTSGSYRYANPLITAATKGGNVLLHATPDAAEIFVERGAAAVSISSATAMASGADKVFFTRRAGKPIAAAGRPSQEFVTAMPMSFRDVLPSRGSRFGGAKPPVPKSDHDVTYAEVERWLTFSSAWDRGLAGRFKPRLQDSAFRQAIEAHLSVLPEWEPIVHPENHKTGTATADKSDSPPGE